MGLAFRWAFMFCCYFFAFGVLASFFIEVNDSGGTHVNLVKLGIGLTALFWAFCLH